MLPQPWQNFAASFFAILLLGSPTFFMGKSQADKPSNSSANLTAKNIAPNGPEPKKADPRQNAALAADRKAEAERQAAKLKIEENRLASKKAEEARKSEEEYDSNGLILLWKTVKAVETQFLGMEITGTVINRRNKTLNYAQINFSIFDESGAQIGSALANINGLEPGARWNFKAQSFNKNGEKFKLSQLSGF
jgi:hypothetical protein